MAFNRNEWKPNAKQAEFLALPLSIKEAFYGGGAGSGKSDVLLIYPLVHKWHENPRFKQVFQRRTYPELRNEIVPRSREIYRRFGAVFNQSSMVWTFPREDQFGSGAKPAGAMIYLGHCENEDDVHQYDSMEINLYTPDELTSFTEWIYTYIGFTRVRKSDPTLPSIIRAAGMPGGIGHTWVKNRFVKNSPKGSVIISGRGGNKRIYVHSTLADNPYIDPGYAQSLEALPAAERDAKKYGSWDAYSGQVFEEFRDKKYADEPENALHVIEPFDIPDWWPKIVAADWGFSPPAMTYVCYGAVSPDKRVYIYREQYWQKFKIAEWCPFVKEFVQVEKPEVIKLCKSAGQDRGLEHTVLSQITDELQYPVQLTTNTPGSRVAGKMLLHEYLRWKPKYMIQREPRTYDNDHAEWLLRNKGLDEYKGYLTSFNAQEPEGNLPRLQIFNTVKLLPEALKSCVYDKKAGVAQEDVAEFPGDDPYDTIRYLVDAADSFFSDAEHKFSKVKAQENLIQMFQTSGDMTAFYRNARKLEKSNQVGPIRLIHHR